MAAGASAEADELDAFESPWLVLVGPSRRLAPEARTMGVAGACAPRDGVNSAQFVPSNGSTAIPRRTARLHRAEVGRGNLVSEETWRRRFIGDPPRSAETVWLVSCSS